MTLAKCKDFFAPNAEVDAWASKLKLVEKYSDVWGFYFIIENLPCWTYEIRSDADEADAVTKITTTYTDKGCWYGVCRHHAYVYTAIFQERVKGQYHSVSGYLTNAVYVVDSKRNHAWTEVYIKDKGYYAIPGGSFPHMIHRPSFTHYTGSIMCNRWLTGNEGHRDAAPYKELWAGPEIAPLPPTIPTPKTYIKASSSPTGASIWLKKH